VANPTNESHPPPKHDVLEVNNYFMSGLVVSSIDKWFMGPVPRFTMQDLGIPALGRDLSAVLERSRKATRNLVRDVCNPILFPHGPS
jgi:anaphase-promoting complex subunit 4